MTFKVTLVFENCEEITINLDNKDYLHTKFVSDDSNEFDSGYIVIPKDVTIGEQTGLVLSNSDHNIGLGRILEHNDITHVIYECDGESHSMLTPWDYEYSEFCNKLQKTFIIEDGSIVVDWNNCFTKGVAK